MSADGQNHGASRHLETVDQTNRENLLARLRRRRHALERHKGRRRERRLLLETLEDRRLLAVVSEELVVDPALPVFADGNQVELALDASSGLSSTKNIEVAALSTEAVLQIYQPGVAVHSSDSQLSSLLTEPILETLHRPGEAFPILSVDYVGGLSAAGDELVNVSSPADSLNLATVYDVVAASGNGTAAQEVASELTGVIEVVPPHANAASPAASGSRVDLFEQAGLTFRDGAAQDPGLNLQGFGHEGTPINVVRLDPPALPQEQTSDSTNLVYGPQYLPAPLVQSDIEHLAPETVFHPGESSHTDVLPEASALPGTLLGGDVLYNVGFEPIDGFSNGFIGGQADWATFPGNTSQPVIANANPSTGSQHVRIAEQAGFVGNVGAISPSIGTRPAGHYEVSMDVAVSGAGGSSYYVSPFSASQGAATAYVVLYQTGDIFVYDNGASGLGYYDTGANWTTGGYQTLTIDMDAAANTIEYSYGGSLIYTGAVWGGTSVELVRFYGDNAGTQFGDFDNVTVEGFNLPQPDLVSARLTSWDDSIPIDVTQNAGDDPHTYDGPFYSDQTLYFNFASWNLGTFVADDYTLRAEVTGTGGMSWQWPGVSTAAGESAYLTNDQAVGPLSAGTHTFRVWLDYADTVSEADEYNNYVERTITVLPAGSPSAQDVTAEPLGISSGVSWFQVDDQITDHGGQKVYAADLVAGQRLSASVQTPEFGGSSYDNSLFIDIPDSGATAVSTIDVPAGQTIDDLDVSFYIDHRNVSDLDIFLVAPNGTRVELSTDNGGTGNHYQNTTIDDEAPVAISGANISAPFFGRYRPESPLSVFDGIDPVGSWRLEVNDDTAGNSPDGLLRGWALRLNQGLDVALTVTGPDGLLAANSSALSGLRDAAIVSVTVPTTGTYLFTVGNENLNAGSYRLEAGIYDDSVPDEAGDTTDLDPLRAANGNIALLGHNDGIGEEDSYTLTLNAGEAVNISGATPGGFTMPQVTVAGPGGFDPGLPYGGPNFDTVQLFTAPTSGTYTINVKYPLDSSYFDLISVGSYVLTVGLSDTANNDSLADARPISTNDYQNPTPGTSWLYGTTGPQGVWRGTIDPAGEFDFFSVGQLAAGQVIRAYVQREGTSELFPDVALINSSSEVIVSSGPLRSPGLEGITYFETIVSEDDSYYLAVVSDTTEAGGSTFSTGAFQLFYADFGKIEDAYEENDSRTEVDAAVAGAANSPNLGVVGAVTLIDDLALMEDTEDWFRFETTATGTRGDYVRIEFENAKGNLNLELFDSSGDVLSRSQGTGDGERVSLHGLSADTYYARVVGYGGANNPDYSLRIQSGAPDQRLLSAPYTTDATYAFSHEIGGVQGSANAALEPGANELFVTTASGGPLPFEMIFDVERVGSLTDHEEYQYDLLGNLSRRTDALRRDTVYDYDALGRLATVDGPDLGDASQFVYDANDNLVSLIDEAAGTTTYDYDELDRLIKITMPNGLGTVQYTYDAAGRVASITYPNGSSVAYAYDAAGQLEQVTDGSDVTTYVYNGAGQMDSMTQPNGVTADYGYDEYGRLTDLIYTTSAGLLVTSFHYTLDANGNRTAMEVRRPDTDTPDPNDFLPGVYGYDYDALNRLVYASYPDGSTVVYTYDANGNRLSTSTDPDGPGVQPAVDEIYHYDYDNRLDSITDSGGGVLKDIHYDPRGNVVLVVTPTDTTRYEYDYRNLLTVVENGSARIEYLYDGNGDRVAEFVNGERTNFVNDPNRHYTQVLAELNAAGVAQSRYTYGTGRISGQLPGDSTTSYYVADALGSTTDLLDPNAAVLQSYSYDAFGALRDTDPGGVVGNVDNEFLFTGESFQLETGLGYFRARYYDAAAGRWLSKDPVGFEDGPNVYGYVTNNPVLLIDPLGTTSSDAEDWFTRFGYGVSAAEYAAKSGSAALKRYLGTRSLTELAKNTLTGRGLSSNKLFQLQDAAKTLGRASVVLGVVDAGLEWGNYYQTSQRWASGQASTLDLVHDGARAVGKSVLAPVGMTWAIDVWDWGTQKLADSIFGNNDRGGVLLNRAAGFVGDLKSITGATVDPTTGQVILLGSDQGGTAVPDLRLDDFIAAVRSVFGSAENAGVTIDPQGDPSLPQLVHLFGGLDNTDMGYVVFEADRVMKSLAAREDNITGNAISSSVSGYYSMLDRKFDRSRAAGGSGADNWNSRFWFVPTDVKLVQSDDGQSFVFDKAAVQLMTEDLLVGNGEVDPDAQAFADWFNANYEAIAAESYAYPSLPGYEYSFQRLEQVARAIAFARFLYDNGIEIDFSWMDHFQPQVVVTPDTTPTVQNSRTETWNSGNTQYTLTITITGGVTMETPNTYVDGTTGLQGVVLGSRPDELVQQFTATVDGQELDAVALSLDTGFVDGLDYRADTDLSYQTPGDLPFGLTRYNNSAEPVPGPFSYGWEFVPLDIDFSRPEFYSSSRAPQAWQDLNGLHEGELRIEDRAAGRVLTFVSSFATGRIGGDFAYGGLNAAGVPDFIAGGTEEPDGSTLVQDPTTLDYTLTRPDGSTAVFDPQGRLIEWIDYLDRAITYGYTDGRVTSISDSAAQTITLTYDASGHVTKADGLAGESVTYVYTSDGLGNLAEADRVKEGIHSKYTYSYNATASADDDHLIFEVTTPDQVLQSKAWKDIFGRTDVEEDARGNRAERAFDPLARTTTTTDTIDGSTQVVQTDSLGRPRVIKDELERTTQLHYNVERVFGGQYPGGWTYVEFTNGNSRQPSLIRLPDPGRPWLFAEYDAAGNLIKLEDIARGGDANDDGIDDNPQLFEYDAANNLVRHTDARGIVTTYTYQVLDAGTPDERITNRQTSMTRGVGTPREATWQWEYFGDTGYLQRQIDSAGVVTEYTYDAKGNVETVVVAPAAAEQLTTTFTYDAFSRRTSATDGENRRNEYEYEGHDLIATTRLVGTPNLESHSSYDAATGRKLSDTDFLGNVTTFVYDATTGDLTSQTSAAGTADENVTDIGFDRFANVEEVGDPVDNSTAFDHDRLQRLIGRASLGSTTRVVTATGTNADLTVTFSDPIDVNLVDNGTDVFVKDSAGQSVAGTPSFSADGRHMTWMATSPPLAVDTYTITLLAASAGEFTSTSGQLLDGEYTGALPSGDNAPSGNFTYPWFVDDHGNDAAHGTSVAVPSSTPGTLDFSTDEDWFRIDAVANTRLGFEVVLGSEVGSLPNSELTLYDQDGTTVLQTNDNIDAARGQYGSKIDWETPLSGTYYLKVTSPASLFAGEFELSVTLLGDDHPDGAPGTSVAVPSVTSGNFEVATDLDTFSFDAVENETYRLTTILGTLGDSTLNLLGTDGTTVLASNDNFYAGNAAAYLYWTAPAAGTYHAQVASAGGQGVGTYELAISIDDHGDSSTVATNVPVPADTAGNIEVKYDGDWFSFAATAGTWYRLEAASTTLANPFLALFSSTQLLVSNDDYQGLDSTIFWQAPATETYFLKVTGHDGDGTYRLQVAALSDDHGNDDANATLVAVPSSTPGNIEMPGDPDWFGFDVAAAGRYRVESQLGSLPDSVLTLYGADGTTQLDQNDDFRGPGSRIDFSASQAGRFYAAVESFNGSFDGTFDISVQELEADLPSGVLVSPAPGSTIHTDSGYVDILWSDGAGSGIDDVTIDKTDVSATGVTLTSVEALGNGVWRYHYSGGLPDGAIQVSLPANHVADLHGNWNALYSATFDYAAPRLTVVLGTDIVAETAGSAATTATVTRTNDDNLAQALTVTLTSGDGSEIGVPATVTILANETFATFDIEALDDAVVDGTQSATITATADGFLSGAATIDVTDHGDLAVVISADSFWENAGASAATATVTRSDGDDLSNPLTLTLTSDDISEVAVPATVTIPADGPGVDFAIDAVEDAVYDGTQTVTVTATTAGFNSGSDTVDVVDHEIIPPALNSKPGAPVTLYLDLDGHFQPQWDSFTNATTPVFDQDNLPNLFTTTELASITELWARVAEDYAPFNVNVTTIEPGDFSDGVGLRVAIGGSSADWFEPQGGGPAGGVAYLDSFTNTLPNVVYVFAEKLANTTKYIAEATSHELGHAFGLRHQSLYDGNGTRLEEYHPGDANWAPIMGVSYSAGRSTWHNGPNSISASSLQDDLAIISSATNGFGYLQDDHGDSTGAATPLNVLGAQKVAVGTIGKMADSDFFSFTTAGGEISFSVEGAPEGPNLDSVLELHAANGDLLASAAPSQSLDASLSTTVAAGDYFLAVRNAGQYGDLGSYTLSGTVPAFLTLVVEPASITENAGADAASGTVYRSHADIDQALTVFLASSDETEAEVPASVTIPAGQASAPFSIEAIDELLADADQVVQLTASATGFTEGTAALTVENNDLAAPASTGPGGTSADTTPTFSWNAVSGAETYELWVYYENTQTHQIVYQNGISATSFTPTAELPLGRYQFWVRAHAAGEMISPWSGTAHFLIAEPLTAPTLTAPTGNNSDTTPTFTWNAVADASTYELWVYSVTTNTHQIIYQNGLTTTSYTPTAGEALLAGDYRFWVRAADSVGTNGPWSAALDFSVGSIPDVPALISPVGLTSDTTPTFSWQDVGADRYVLWVTESASGVRVIYETNLTANSFTPSAALASGAHTFWIQAFNSVGQTSGWSARGDFTIGAVLPAPTIIGPAGNTFDTTPTFSWNAIAGAVRYELSVYSQTTSTHNVVHEANLTGTSFTPSVAMSSGRYQYWMRTQSADGLWGAWSAATSFSIGIPEVPVLIGPSGNTSDTTPTFNWNAATGAARYELWVYDFTMNTHQVIHETNITGTSHTSATALILGHTYWFWVRAINSDDLVGEWSNYFEFTIL